MQGFSVGKQREAHGTLETQKRIKEMFQLQYFVGSKGWSTEREGVMKDSVGTCFATGIDSLTLICLFHKYNHQGSKSGYLWKVREADLKFRSQIQPCLCWHRFHLRLIIFFHSFLDWKHL